jgi:hypothetical protein
LSLKILNSSSKSEFIETTGPPRVCVHYHLPGSFEYRRRTESLPIGDVEGTIHVRQPAIAFHREYGLLGHLRSSHFSVCRKLLERTFGGARSAGRQFR